MEWVIHLFGYLASVLLAISLMVNNDLKFRWLNTFGCLSFIIYGILIAAFPIIITNAILLLINVYRIVRIHQTHENFDMIEFAPDDQFISKFILFYKHDIHHYFPLFNADKNAVEIRFAVLRDMVLANIFMAKLNADGTADVIINYTVPKYRDYQVGKYIFEKEKNYLVGKGVKKIIYQHDIHAHHKAFLKVMGFKKEINNEKELWVKYLSV